MNEMNKSKFKIIVSRYFILFVFSFSEGWLHWSFSAFLQLQPAVEKSKNSLVQIINVLIVLEANNINSLANRN